MKHGKKYVDSVKAIDSAKLYDAAEGISLVLDSAKAKYHDVCRTLWNAQDVIRATVVILDSEFNVVGDYREVITHEAQAQGE